MKKEILIALSLLALPCFSQENTPPEEGARRGRGFNPEMMGMMIVARELMTEQYDADKDGKLSKEEMTAARDAWNKATPALQEKIKELMSGMSPMRPRASEMVMASMLPLIKKYDKDGDGSLSEAELNSIKADAREAMKKRREDMIKQYDKDGDGKLSREEWQAIREEMRRKRHEKSPM